MAVFAFLDEAKEPLLVACSTRGIAPAFCGSTRHKAAYCTKKEQLHLRKYAMLADRPSSSLYDGLKE